MIYACLGTLFPKFGLPACLPTRTKKKMVFRQMSLICCTTRLYHHTNVNTSRKRKVGTLTWGWEERRDQTSCFQQLCEFRFDLSAV